MRKQQLTSGQLITMTLLRMAVGWYILYQGIAKYYSPSWSARGYLMSSDGPLSGFFQSLAASDALLQYIDWLNVYGQLAIGAGLILGLFSRMAALSGGIMLLLYYLAHPPFIGLSSAHNSLVINELLITCLALFAMMMFPTSNRLGIDRFLFGSTR